MTLGGYKVNLPDNPSIPLVCFILRLFGPRKKLMNAIARWHSKARPALGDLEQCYADRLEGEMQEMGVQLQMVSKVVMTSCGY